MFQNFVTYQRLLLAEFRRLADRYGFAVVDARGAAADIFREVKEEVAQVVRGMPLDNPVTEVSLEPDLGIGAFGSDVLGNDDADGQASERSALGGSSQRR
jgi:hypothetical protein